MTCVNNGICFDDINIADAKKRIFRVLWMDLDDKDGLWRKNATRSFVPKRVWKCILLFGMGFRFQPYLLTMIALDVYRNGEEMVQCTKTLSEKTKQNFYFSLKSILCLIHCLFNMNTIFVPFLRRIFLHCTFLLKPSNLSVRCKGTYVFSTL